MRRPRRQPADIINLQGTKWSKDVTSMFEAGSANPSTADRRGSQRLLEKMERPRRCHRRQIRQTHQRPPRPSRRQSKARRCPRRTESKAQKGPRRRRCLELPHVSRGFLKFADFRRSYGDVSVLPTPAYYYGVQIKEEISVHLEEGKTLFIRLVNLTEADPAGQQTAIFELNGYPRHTTVANATLAKQAVTRAKADPGNSSEVGAPMPGMVASIAVSIGQKVKEGETLLTLEAMKMFAAISAPAPGTIQEICVKVSESVESKDLLIRMAIVIILNCASTSFLFLNRPLGLSESVLHSHRSDPSFTSLTRRD
jgi:pyruvate carboxylase